MRLGKNILFLAVPLLIAACGSNNQIIRPGSDVAAIEVIVSDDPVEINQPSRLWVIVTLIDGTVVEGVSTSIVDPEANQTTYVEWSVSDVNIAEIEETSNEAWLYPNIEGYVTVHAKIGDVENSRVVRVDDPRTPD